MLWGQLRLPLLHGGTTMIVIGGVIGLVILLLILGALVENDYPGWSTLMAASSFALFMGMRGVTLPETWLWIKTNPGILVLVAMAYLALGTGWAVIKWWSYVRKQLRNWKPRNYGTGATEPQRILVKEHKSRIMTWMSFWPMSLLWTLLNDPIRKLFTEIYTRISGTLQKIADREYEKFAK
jgi:hypothetical protein